MAAVKIAKLNGAQVTGVTAPAKADAVREAGADSILDRGTPPAPDSVDVVVDVVGGQGFPALLDALVPGGHCATSGAIAGPIVELDVRDLYLRDLTFYGSTYQPDNILPDVIGYIERGELRPLIAAEFALKDLAAAQEAFISKSHIGKIAIRVA